MRHPCPVAGRSTGRLHLMSTTTFRVTSNVDQTIKDLLGFGAAVKEKAVVRTLNDVAAQLRTRASREIRAAGYQLKAGALRNALRPIKASRSSLWAGISASGRPIPLIDYGAREVSTGVSVNVEHGRKVISHAFIATMPGGHRGVFAREPGAKARKVVKAGRVQWETLPITQLFGPGIPDALANKVVANGLQSLVDEKFDTILRRNIAYYASRA